MEKIDVYRDLLMLYIKDNHKPVNTDKLTPQQAFKIETNIPVFLKTYLGKKGCKLYIQWCVKCMDYPVEMCEKIYEETEKDKTIKKDYLLGVAKLFCVDNSLDQYKTEDDILEERYIEMKSEFEKNHFKCKDNYYVIENNSLCPFNKNSFKTIYEDKYYDSDNSECFIERWFKDPVKRTYDKIDFIPNGNEPGVFNTWDIVCKKDHEITEDVSTEDLHELIFKVCGNKKDNYHYFMKYLAHLIQFPEKKPEVCIFFTSAQGSGKDTLVDLINLILGNSLVGFENDPERIFGKFNMGTRQNKLVVVLQEADNIKQYAGKIKDLITCKNTTLEQKNVRSFTIKDFTRLILLSNNENIIKIEPDDRRFVVYKSYNFKVAPNPKFFTRVYKCLENPNCIQKFLNELCSYNIQKDFNFQINRPDTEIYNSLKEANTPAIIKWAHRFIEQDISKLESNKMCDSYNDYCSETYEQSTRVNSSSFGLTLRKYFYINDNWIGFEKHRCKSGNSFAINKEELKELIENSYNYIGYL